MLHNRKIFDSPVIRRAKKAGINISSIPEQPQMRRSISLQVIDIDEPSTPDLEPIVVEPAVDRVTEAVIENCAEFLEDHNDPSAQTIPDLEASEAERSKKESTGSREKTPNEFGTLPKVMRKNISRSLVPKMRRMFERAKSLEPSTNVPSIRIKVHSTTEDHPSHAHLLRSLISLRRALSSSPDRVLSPESGISTAGVDSDEDGTESVSSFVALSNDGSTTLSPGTSTVTSPSSSTSAVTLTSGGFSRKDDSRASGSGSLKKGFVNKCMSKVKNIMHSGGSNDSVHSQGDK